MIQVVYVQGALWYRRLVWCLVSGGGISEWWQSILWLIRRCNAQRTCATGLEPSIDAALVEVMVAW
jgi:hypothetical protein